MGSKLANNATSTLANSITALATSLAVASGEGARFPILGAGDWFPATLIKLVGAEVQREIVKVTARTLDVFTIERGFDNTTALSFTAGDKVELRPCAAVLNEKVGPDALLPYAKLAGGNTFTGQQRVESLRFKLIPLGNVSGALSIDVSLASTFTMTAIGPTVITLTGVPPAGEDQQTYLKITNGGGRVTWQPGTMASKGIAPVLTAAGRDTVAVLYDPELACNIVGLAFQDYKAIP